jgi:hypothetical protein
MVDVPIPYLQTPATIVNQALDRIGASDKIIGDVTTDGSPIAEAARRNYGQLLRQLLRTAHWDFARRFARLTLLADSSGQTPNVSTVVECPWQYAYAWPIDGVLGRWMPFTPSNGQPQQPDGTPLTTGQTLLTPYPQMPGRFLVSSSAEYPVEVGQVPWDQMPDLQRTEGVGPNFRKIILTNCCNAHFVYTRLCPVVEEWDDLFREAMVTLLALALIPVAIADPKLARAYRNDMIAIAKNAIADARVANGNEAGFPQSVDHQPNWITARNGGWWNGTGYSQGAYSGYAYYPWDASMQWCGSVF